MRPVTALAVLLVACGPSTSGPDAEEECKHKVEAVQCLASKDVPDCDACCDQTWADAEPRKQCRDLCDDWAGCLER